MNLRRFAALVALLLAPSALAGQQRAAQPAAKRCNLEFPNTEFTRSQTIKDPVSGRYNTFLGGGVVGRCIGQDITVVADSAELYDSIRLYYLIGSVQYREPRMSLDADKITYFRTEERLLAEGRVNATLENGSTFQGSHAEYFRAVPPMRTASRMFANFRPTVTFVERDSAGAPREPVVLLANQINAVGDSLYYAGGQVVITRPDLDARGDSAFVDNQGGFSRLLRDPEIVSKGERPFTLEGLTIDIYSRDRLVERVVSNDSAQAVSEDMTLSADTIDLRVRDNKLQHAYAWGVGGARSVSPGRDITADSLDIDMPDQRIREVRALRDAYAETAVDSTRMKSTERDWIRGDTIIAQFDTAATADTASRPRIRQLRATHEASSFYQVPSKRGASAPPSINYVRGREIVVAFANGQVLSVAVVDKAVGVMVEPAADTTAAPAGRPAAVPPTPPPGVRP
jgi:hypothetical protein